MLRRVLVATVVGAGLLTASGAADAARPPTSWQDAVALAAYPVYRPTHTLGLPERVTTGPCGVGKVWVGATYRRAGARLGVYEGSPYVCGNAGESHTVKQVRIGGREVALQVFCAHPYPCLQDTDGYRYGYLLLFFERDHPRTMVQLTSVHVRERAFLRFARSLRRVRPAAATLHLTNFLSPDGAFWCTVTRSAAWCGAQAPVARTASVDRSGAVTECVAMGPGGCLQNWDDRAPVLRADQRIEVDGFACVPSTGAMTCTVAAGAAAAGQGFRIDATSIAPVGGATITPGTG